MQQSRQQTRTFYDRISGVYDLMAERSEAPVRRRARELLDLRPGESVLEVGCGTGSSLVALAHAAGPAGRVLGLDLSPRMLRRAARRLRRSGMEGRVTLECADAAALPYADAELDAVLTTFTLELFDTPEIPRVLAGCRRVLRAGGRLVVGGTSRVGPPSRALRIFEWMHRRFPTCMNCRPIFIANAIRAAGFTISHSELLQVWLPVEVVAARKV